MRTRILATLSATVLASGLGLGLTTAVASADPPPQANANCTAGEATAFHDIGSFWAHLPAPDGSNKSYVGWASSSCAFGQQ